MNDQQSSGQQAYEQAQQKRKKQRQGKDKTIIKVERGQEDLVWRKVQAAAIKANCQIFVRGGELVEPLWRKERVSGETDRKFMTMSLVKYNKSRLTDQLIHNAVTFMAWDKEAGWVSINAPTAIIEMLLERGFWDFPSVKGVINTPTMRPDGSLLTAQGYDPRTELWLKTDSDLILPPIPDAPSKEDAL
jgi:putative DNA primase/helicase